MPTLLYLLEQGALDAPLSSRETSAMIDLDRVGSCEQSVLKLLGTIFRLLSRAPHTLIGMFLQS